MFPPILPLLAALGSWSDTGSQEVPGVHFVGLHGEATGVTVESRHFIALVLDKTQSAATIRYGDAAYDELARILGFVPKAGAKLPLRILSYGRTAYYITADGGHINFPREAIENGEWLEWLVLAFPHELTHNFLLEQFPNPPRWFIEGPASYFGHQVAEALGFQKSAADDRRKILGWAENYDRLHGRYLFGAEWPEDQLPFGTPSLGMGAGYQLCTDLEGLCGKGFFRKVFQYMQTCRITFAGARSEQEKNWILIAAMQSQTREDLWQFFAKKGFR